MTAERGFLDDAYDRLEYLSLTRARMAADDPQQPAIADEIKMLSRRVAFFEGTPPEPEDQPWREIPSAS